MGCAYDWEIGAPVDAGSDAGAGGQDAGAHDAGDDAGEHDAGPHDAGPQDAGPHDAGPDCAMLEATLSSARAAAKACTLGEAGQCATSIEDECGCTSYVNQDGSAFAAAVQAVKAAGCTSTCGTCLVSPGACLLNGGTQAVCVP
jgi:hypothetical protein